MRRTIAALGLVLCGCTAESAINECELEAAKAAAAMPSGLDVREAEYRKRRVLAFCMASKGYRRADGGTDLHPSHISEWERDWPFRRLLESKRK